MNKYLLQIVSRKRERLREQAIHKKQMQKLFLLKVNFSTWSITPHVVDFLRVISFFKSLFGALNLKRRYSYPCGAPLTHFIS